MDGCWENGIVFLPKKMLHMFNYIKIMVAGAK